MTPTIGNHAFEAGLIEHDRCEKCGIPADEHWRWDVERMTKWCITCAHYGGVGGFFTKKGSFPYHTHACMHPEARINVVTGATVCAMVPCEKARKIGKPCGPDGKLWEMRNDS